MASQDLSSKCSGSNGPAADGNSVVVLLIISDDRRIRGFVWRCFGKTPTASLRFTTSITLNHLLGLVGIAIKRVALEDTGFASGDWKHLRFICQCVYIYVFKSSFSTTVCIYKTEKESKSITHIKLCCISNENLSG